MVPYFLLSLFAQEGPDAHGVYTVVWAGGDTSFSAVHAMHMRHESGYSCGLDTAVAKAPTALNERFTLLLRMHWEASDPAWRGRALWEIKKEVVPDEMVSDFDWHVILRFLDRTACEHAHEILQKTLSICKDPNSCYSHPYVRAIEEVSCRGAVEAE